MRPLRGDWQDLLFCFPLAFLSPRKMALALIGLTASAAIFGMVALVLLPTFQHGTFTMRALAEAIDALVQKGGRPDFVSLVGYIALQLSSLNGLEWFVFLVALFAPLWLVWSHYGAAISRIAVHDVAHHQAVHNLELKNYIRDHYRSAFWSPVSLLLGILGFAALTAAIACACRLPGWFGFGGLLLNLLYLPFGLLGALASAYIFVLGLLTLPILIPIVMTEGTGATDTVSRAFSIVQDGFFRYIFYLLVAFLFGAASYWLVLEFTELTLKFHLFALQLGLGEPRFRDLSEVLALQDQANLDISNLNQILGTATLALHWVLRALSLAYGPAYFFCSGTMIFLLLRKNIDGIEFRQIVEVMDYRP